MDRKQALVSAAAILTSAAAIGLERSCGAENRVRTGTSRPGFERAEASFSTMRFAPHRHDSYAIGITLRGVQSFGYRGTTRHSAAGCAFVIHPDETHDGRAGTDEGYGYRILYVAPHLIAEALGSRALPFVRDAVTRETALRRAIRAALAAFDIVYVSTAGGPGNSTAVPGIQIYILAFTEQRIGLASALAVILMLLVLVVILPIQRLSRESTQ